MVLVKVLKRKDAASVIVAVTLALVLSSFLAAVSYDASSELTEFLSGKESSLDSGAGWDQQYLLPFVALVVQVFVLELLVRVLIGLKSFWKSSK